MHQVTDIVFVQTHTVQLREKLPVDLGLREIEVGVRLAIYGGCRACVCVCMLLCRALPGFTAGPATAWSSRGRLCVCVAAHLLLL
jgi:hypothetical protein